MRSSCGSPSYKSRRLRRTLSRNAPCSCSSSSSTSACARVKRQVGEIPRVRGPHLPLGGAYMAEALRSDSRLDRHHPVESTSALTASRAPGACATSLPLRPSRPPLTPLTANVIFLIKGKRPSCSVVTCGLTCTSRKTSSACLQHLEALILLVLAYLDDPPCPCPSRPDSSAKVRRGGFGSGVIFEGRNLVRILSGASASPSSPHCASFFVLILGVFDLGMHHAGEPALAHAAPRSSSCA